MLADDALVDIGARYLDDFNVIQEMVIDSRFPSSARYISCSQSHTSITVTKVLLLSYHFLA
jgi:hypothetical protein